MSFNYKQRASRDYAANFDRVFGPKCEHKLSAMSHRDSANCQFVIQVLCERCGRLEQDRLSDGLGLDIPTRRINEVLADLEQRFTA